MTVNKNKQTFGNLTSLVEKRTAVAMFLILLIVVCFVGTLSGGEASIGGFSENPAPTAFKVTLTTDGAISVFAPADISGHWETNNLFFSEQAEMFFCPMERFGVIKYTFVPDDPVRCQSSVYAIVCRFAG